MPNNGYRKYTFGFPVIADINAEYLTLSISLY